MNTKMGLVVVPLLVMLGTSPTNAAEREPQPAPIVLTVESLSDALLEIGAERDALRAALGKAQEEIARGRAAYDSQKTDLTECESDIARSLHLSSALMESNRTLSGLVTEERKAATRARWLSHIGCAVGVGAAGWSEASAGAAVACGWRF